MFNSQNIGEKLNYPRICKELSTNSRLPNFLLCHGVTKAVQIHSLDGWIIQLQSYSALWVFSSYWVCIDSTIVVVVHYET